jgi:hypothetical protein
MGATSYAKTWSAIAASAEQVMGLELRLLKEENRSSI